MTKEQLMAMGLTEEQATKIIDGYGVMIPKSRFDELNEAKKKLETDLTDRDSQLVELGKTAGLSEDLKVQITQLQTDNQAATEIHKTEMKELAMSNAIKLALNGKVHDEGLAASLIDKEKLVIDGDNIIGLDEQLNGLKESKAFLFKTDTPPANTPPPGFKIGTDGKQTPIEAKPASLQDAISAHFNSQPQ